MNGTGLWISVESQSVYPTAAYAAKKTAKAKGMTHQGRAASKGEAALFRAFVEEVFNQGKVEAASKYFTPDFVDHDGFPGKEPNLRGFQEGLREFHKAFPGLRGELEQVVASGDKVVAYGAFTGRHEGAFMGAPPTGREFRVKFVDIVRFKGGKIAEHWGVFDSGALLEQLGFQLAPPVPSR